MLKWNAFHAHDKYSDYDTISINMKLSNRDKTKSSEKKINEQNQTNRSNKCEYSILTYEYYHQFILWWCWRSWIKKKRIIVLLIVKTIWLFDKKIFFLNNEY